MLLSLAIAVLVAVLAASAVTALVSRRIAAPVSGLATAAGLLAAGRYGTRAREPGLGPEFAIAKAIITAHQGTIQAHSAGPGHGATFTITLPIHRAA